MSQTPRPVLRVVRGEPTPEELAALVAVVLARTEAAADERRRGPAWADHASQLRVPLWTGRGGWRTSTRT